MLNQCFQEQPTLLNPVFFCSDDVVAVEILLRCNISEQDFKFVSPQYVGRFMVKV